MDVQKFVTPAALEAVVETMERGEDGKPKVLRLRCEQVTQDMLRRIGVAAEKRAEVALYEQMSVFFGGKAADYFVVDVRVVRQVIAWCTAQMKDPT